MRRRGYNSTENVRLLSSWDDADAELLLRSLPSITNKNLAVFEETSGMCERIVTLDEVKQVLWGRSKEAMSEILALWKVSKLNLPQSHT